MPDVKILASDLGFPEGPVWMADGSVILGEISGKKVTRVAPDGSKSEIGKAGGGPNGVATGPDGALYVCNNGGNFEMNDVGGLMIPGHTPPESCQPPPEPPNPSPSSARLGSADTAS